MSPTETTDAVKTEATKKDIKREISVEIPAAEVARETELQIQRYQKSARLPGFRAGHVPASIIKQRFGDGLKNDVAEALIPKYFRREAEKQGLIPVSQPRVTDLHMHDGEPLTFKASFEVLPEIQVEGYKDLRADQPEIAVTDDDVEQALTSLREQHATYTTVEGRPLAGGDFAQASMDGKPKDGKDVADAKANPVHMDDVLIEIGGKNTVRGVQPESYRSIRRRRAHLRCELSRRYFRQTASRQDFCLHGEGQRHQAEEPARAERRLRQRVGRVHQSRPVRKQIRDNMEAEKRHTAEHAAKDKLVAELVKRNDFEVPESLVDRQIDLRLERGLRALGRPGHEDGRLKEDGLAPPSGRPARAGGAGCKVFFIAGTDRGSGKNRGQRRGSEPGVGGTGSTVKTDVRSSARSFDRGWGPR